MANVYTEEHIEWLRERTATMPYKDITSQFNQTFNMNVTINNIYDTRKRYKLPKQRKNCGNWKVGHIAANAVKKGTEREREHYIYVKIDGSNRWRKKHHLVWEEHHPPLTSNQVLFFIDGNTKNCAIENLLAISRTLHLYLINTKLFYAPSELRLTALAIGRLEVELKEVK